MSPPEADKQEASRGRAEAARRAAAETRQAADAQQDPKDPRKDLKAAFAPAGRPSDIFGADLPLRAAAGADGPRRRDVFSLLVLHLISRSEGGASYGNRLIELIESVTEGTVVLNPNTIYPLLRDLEQRGLIEGRWEHPEKRSRRLYSATAAGTAEYERLKQSLEPFLDSIVRSISLIKHEVYGNGPPPTANG